jgi:hypothetical protein
MLISLMGNGRFCWYHALHDLVSTRDGKMNIFELVQATRTSHAVNVSDMRLTMISNCVHDYILTSGLQSFLIGTRENGFHDTANALPSKRLSIDHDARRRRK